MKRALALSLLILLWRAVAWANDADDLARARVQLTTDAGLAAQCVPLGTIGDDSVKDLRKKVVRIGGDTAVMYVGIDYISARVFRCGDVRAPSPPPPAPAVSPLPAPPVQELSGTFGGTISGNAKGGQPFTLNTTFTLVQTGRQLTGVWTTTAGTTGGITGVLAESGAPRLQIHQVSPCDGDFVAVAVVEAAGNRLRGSYVGLDCSGEVTGSFVVDRQATGQATSQPSASGATETAQATAEWECRRDLQALTANSRYATWGPVWWNLWQGHEQEEKIKDSRAMLFSSCMRARGF